MTEENKLKVRTIMKGRFGKDSLISLATCANNIPSVRTVNGYYENGCFYVITYALSGKMQQISTNPIVAISGEWFSSQGIGKNLGWFGKEENKMMASKLRKVYEEWIDNGHNNYEDHNTIILCIELTKRTLFAEGVRYDLDFRLL